jgi:hypothetical protein
VVGIRGEFKADRVIILFPIFHNLSNFTLWIRPHLFKHKTPTMKRRKFIQDSSVLALSIGVFGKIKWDGEKYIGTDPTTTDILGPFYRPGAPFKTDLIQPGTKGETLYFSGTVFGKDGKTPVNGGLVEIWHCNEDGVYDNTSDKYVYRASAKTSADGKYHFKTIMPVPYAAGQTVIRPAAYSYAHFCKRRTGSCNTDLF